MHQGMKTGRRLSMDPVERVAILSAAGTGLFNQTEAGCVVLS